MDIQRINTYNDNQFSKAVLLQHGCFLVDGKPYEVEIISDYEAIIRGENQAVYAAVIGEFRFYTPHITQFYDKDGKKVMEYPRLSLLTLRLEQIQPSQFYVDEDKINAISSFIHKPQDIIIQVFPDKERYISLDGHTRLYYAVMMGWTEVRAVEEASGDYIFDFVEEARRRNIRSPFDLEPLDHNTYEQKWNRFCDDFFAQRESGA